MAIAHRTRLALLLCGAGVLASSCSLLGVGDKSLGDSRGLPAVRTIRLADVVGEVHVRVGTPSVQRTVRYSGDRAPGSTYRMDGDTLTLRGCADVPDCQVDYTVTVPASARVTGRADSGQISVNGLSGVDVRSGSGDFRADDIAGPVSLTLDSGEVRLNRVRGDVSVRTGSGSVQGTGLAGRSVRVHGTSGEIRLGLSDPSTVQAVTESGEVELTVPRRTYRVDAGGQQSTRHIDVPRDDGSPRTLTVGSRSGEVSVHS